MNSTLSSQFIDRPCYRYERNINNILLKVNEIQPKTIEEIISLVSQKQTVKDPDILKNDEVLYQKMGEYFSKSSFIFKPKKDRYVLTKTIGGSEMDFSLDGIISLKTISSIVFDKMRNSEDSPDIFDIINEIIDKYKAVRGGYYGQTLFPCREGSPRIHTINVARYKPLLDRIDYTLADIRFYLLSNDLTTEKHFRGEIPYLNDIYICNIDTNKWLTAYCKPGGGGWKQLVKDMKWDIYVYNNSEENYPVYDLSGSENGKPNKVIMQWPWEKKNLKPADSIYLQNIVNLCSKKRLKPRDQ